MSNNLTKQRASKAAELFKKPAGKLEPIDLTTARFIPKGMTRSYKNNRVIVMVYDNTLTTNNHFAIKVLVQRLDNTPLPNHWRTLQDIKNELFGEETTAIEYYPKESKLLDTHNIYWFWVFKDGVIPEYDATI